MLNAHFSSTNGLSLRPNYTESRPGSIPRMRLRSLQLVIHLI